jgi:hypothetical protein
MMYPLLLFENNVRRELSRETSIEEKIPNTDALLL